MPKIQIETTGNIATSRIELDGAPVVGPANSLTVTNPASYLRRFYRIRLPDICP